MSTRITPAFEAEFGELMDNWQKFTPNGFYIKGMEIMDRYCLIQTVIAPPEEFLTHIENRNKSMLNQKNVHTKGEIIFNIGADRKQLITAICVELAPAGPTRLANIEANRKLIKRSAGLLAPINGRERYLSLGCGHTVAFCKTCKVGGRTFLILLQDKDGMLDVGKIKKQPEFKAMIEEGWEWKVIPWDVDALYPRFAKVTQKALNGSNSAATEISEMDAAMALAELMEEMKDQAGWEKIAIEKVSESCMTCAVFLPVILDFVKLYGGGPGAPHIQLMENLGKKFNSALVLGQEFWRALVYTEFCDKTNKHPLLRMAMALVNLTTESSKAIITKSDVSRVAGKAYVSSAKTAEEVMQQALEAIQILTDAGTEYDDLLEALGQLLVRIGISVTQKHQSGPDGKELTMKQIKKLFIDACSKVFGQPVNFLDWGHAQNAPEVPVVAVIAAPESATLNDHSSATWIAGNKNFKVGKFIKENNKYDIFKIKEIQDDTLEIIVLKVQKYTSAEPEFEASVTLEDLLASWRVIGGGVVPEKSKFKELRPNTIMLELAKLKVFQALVDLDESKRDQLTDYNIEFWKKQTCCAPLKSSCPRVSSHWFP